MRSLGARDAMDFDDGGSTAMTVGTRVVNRPSDPGGERAVSDGLFVLIALRVFPPVRLRTPALKAARPGGDDGCNDVC